MTTEPTEPDVKQGRIARDVRLALQQWLGAWGLLVLTAGYAAFEYGIRPLVEAWLPEVREAAAEVQRRKSTTCT